MADEDHARIERDNTVWFTKHTETGEYAHRTETPVAIDGGDFPLGVGNKYGPFIYVPLPVSGITRWGFQREEGLALFLADVKAGTLPKGGKPKDAPPMKPKPVVAAKEPDPFDALDMGPPYIEGPQPGPEHMEEPDPFAALDTAAADEPDPFAALAPEPAPAPATEPVTAPDGSEDTTVPPHDLDLSADEEPEADEWGVVIEKPGKPASAVAEPDPFEGLL